jgi:hypothetical protein
VDTTLSNPAAGTAGDIDGLYRQATRSAFENFVEVGANYDTEFDNVGFALGGSYVYAGSKGDFNGQDVEDLNAYQVGTSVNFMGFTVGGGYVFQGESGQLANSTNSQDSTGYNFGIQYETGPFIVGANGLISESAGYGSKDNESEVYSLGATYILAPGLSTFVEGSFVSTEGSFYSSTAANNTQNFDNDGSVFLLGTKVEF